MKIKTLPTKEKKIKEGRKKVDELKLILKKKRVSENEFQKEKRQTGNVKENGENERNIQ